MRHLSAETGFVGRGAIVATAEGVASADATSNYTTLSQLSIDLQQTGTWAFSLSMFVISNSTSTGRTIKGAVGFSGTSSSILYYNRFLAISASTPSVAAVSTAWDQNTIIQPSTTGTQVIWMHLEGRFTNSTTGILAGKVGKDLAVAGHTVLAQPGSTLTLYQVS